MKELFAYRVAKYQPNADIVRVRILDWRGNEGQYTRYDGVHLPKTTHTSNYFEHYRQAQNFRTQRAQKDIQEARRALDRANEENARVQGESRMDEQAYFHHLAVRDGFTGPTPPESDNVQPNKDYQGDPDDPSSHCG